MKVNLRPTIFQLPMAGWKEHVRLPKLRMGPIVAKLDTGARSAALHADEIHVRGKRVIFVVKDGSRRHTYKAPLSGLRRVKSSNGLSELRPMVRVTLQVGSQLFKAEVTLTDRAGMDVPMLLGRSTLKGRFLVNPARTFLLGTKNPKDKRK